MIKIKIKKPQIKPLNLRSLKWDSTATITFGDVAENHIGMEKIGTEASSGFSYDELIAAKERFERAGATCEFIELNKSLPDGYVADEAAVLIIREGVKYFDIDPDELFKEQLALDPDKKYYDRRRKRVLNKSARFNLCFADHSQEPDYESGKGRIVSFSDIPMLNAIRGRLDEFIGPKAKDLAAEGNYYYDPRKCGIGFHGDAERKKVVAIRLGKTIPLHYQWFLRFNSVGDRVKLDLNHGDMYVMSDKAVGFDWRRSSILTLRHAAGATKYLTTSR